MIIRYVLPILNLLINGVVLFFLFRLFATFYDFEILVSILFFFFFVMMAVNGIWSNVFKFLSKPKNFNLLIFVQFLSSLLIVQLLGWLFSLYLAFVLMLIILLLQKRHHFFIFYLHLCGCAMGLLMLYINFLN